MFKKGDKIKLRDGRVGVIESGPFPMGSQEMYHIRLDGGRLTDAAERNIALANSALNAKFKIACNYTKDELRSQLAKAYKVTDVAGARRFTDKVLAAEEAKNRGALTSGGAIARRVASKKISYQLLKDIDSIFPGSVDQSRMRRIFDGAMYNSASTNSVVRNALAWRAKNATYLIGGSQRHFEKGDALLYRGKEPVRVVDFDFWDGKQILTVKRKDGKTFRCKGNELAKGPFAEWSRLWND